MKFSESKMLSATIFKIVDNFGLYIGGNKARIFPKASEILEETDEYQVIKVYKGKDYILSDNDEIEILVSFPPAYRNDIPGDDNE